MAGIADSPVAPLQLNSADQAANQSVSPAVGDLMSGFRSGFITAEDIQKRTLDKPVEQAQRREALADANLIRPAARNTQLQQLDVQGQLLGNQSKKAAIDNKSLDKQAEIQPKLDDATLLQADELLSAAERGNDKNAMLNFHQTVANPGQEPPYLVEGEPSSGYDYAKISATNRDFLKSQRELQKANALGKFIKTFSTETKGADGTTKNNVTRMNELTGEVLGSTEIGSSPKQKTQLGESETQRVNQARMARANLGSVRTAFENLVKKSPNLVGPIAGRLLGPIAGEYDVNYQKLENAVNATTPGLARGVFGEVGVLTDRDVERYTKLLPTARKDPKVARELWKDIDETVELAEHLLLDTYEKRGSDVSGFRGDTPPQRVAELKALYEQRTGQPGLFAKRDSKGGAAAPGVTPAAPAAPASPDVPVEVTDPAQAPATAKYIKAPNGKTYKNPKYVPTP